MCHFQALQRLYMNMNINITTNFPNTQHLTSPTGQHDQVVAEQGGVPRDVSEEHAGVGAPGEQPHQHQGHACLPQPSLDLEM